MISHAFRNYNPRAITATYGQLSAMQSNRQTLENKSSELIRTLRKSITRPFENTSLTQHRKYMHGLMHFQNQNVSVK